METYEYEGKTLIKIKAPSFYSCTGCFVNDQQHNTTQSLFCGHVCRFDNFSIFVEQAKDSQKHSHYFKDVSKLDTIDVYQVLYLFEVTDPCVQHAVKKLLCAGQRGSKDKNKDIQEAIDTLNRYKEINNAS